MNRLSRAKQSVKSKLGCSEKNLLLSGRILASLNQQKKSICRLRDVEFSVSSQWGEDGILEWIISHFRDIPQIFIEFGVENYTECNTRFLLQNRNWRGLVIDSSASHVSFIKNDPLSWKHQLSAIQAFITKDNINALFQSQGFEGEIGLLSIDIDGNDFWVWDNITCIAPWIIIVEYNAVFGDCLPLTIPYDENFMRGNAHFSNLYYGASISAFEHIASRRGYSLLGSNGAGSNAFFVRDDFLELFAGIQDRRPLPSRFREGRTPKNALSYLSGIDRGSVISHLPLLDVSTMTLAKLSDQPSLFSDYWTSLL